MKGRGQEFPVFPVLRPAGENHRITSKNWFKHIHVPGLEYHRIRPKNILDVFRAARKNQGSTHRVAPKRLSVPANCSFEESVRIPDIGKGG